jgi:hypothetical protein
VCYFSFVVCVCGSHAYPGKNEKGHEIRSRRACPLGGWCNYNVFFLVSPCITFFSAGYALIERLFFGMAPQIVGAVVVLAVVVVAVVVVVVLLVVVVALVVVLVVGVCVCICSCFESVVIFLSPCRGWLFESYCCLDVAS